MPAWRTSTRQTRIALRAGAFLAVIALTLTLFFTAAAHSPSAAEPTPPPYVPGEIVARLISSPAEKAMAENLAARHLEPLSTVPEVAITRLRAPAGREEELAHWLVEAELAHYAAPNYYVYAAGEPNDPYWSTQWNMRAIHAPGAWDIITGTQTVTIAMLDSGIDLDHPDLAGKLVPGWDYVNSDPTPDDDYGHGTHVAGIIGALTNNGIGVAGLDWQARLLPIKVLDAQGVGTYYNIIAGIHYAANVAQVINLSLVGWDDFPGLHDAVSYAANTKGRLVVAAAGNCGDGAAGCPGLNPVAYPAAYEEVIAVGAATRDLGWAPYSEYHPYLDLSAPGGDAVNPILSTVPDNSYGSKRGTSMAAAHVSGAAGLLWALNPALTAQEIRAVLYNSAVKIGSYPYVGGRNIYFGYGMVNAEAALRQIAPSLAAEPATLTFLVGNNRPVSAGYVTVGNVSPYSMLYWQAFVTEGAQWFEISAGSSGVLAAGETATVTLRPKRSAMSTPGVYTGTLTITSPTRAVQNSPQRIALRAVYVPTLRVALLPTQMRQAGGEYGYQWYDARSEGIALTLPDDASVRVNMPFGFPFYGTRYDQVWVSSNGFLSFGAPYAPADQNHCLPNPLDPNNAIYAFWDDLDPSSIGGVFVKTIDAETFVVEWYDVPHAAKSGGTSQARETFEVILRADGTIKLQYQTVSRPDSCTVGVENSAGVMAEPVLCNGVGEGLYNRRVFLLTTTP